MKYFSKGELCLWGVSSAAVLLSFFLFDRVNYLTLAASLIGVTSLIFNAKGNPFGQVLMVVFSLLYGIISWSFAYYGEMITCLGISRQRYLRLPQLAAHEETARRLISGKRHYPNAYKSAIL